ncbi:MAG TPA: hypothetical protein VMB24_04660 [Dehalococcoidales bacterium]|nr:hypothetical protein [Dehalococcoidales bacterium]
MRVIAIIVIILGVASLVAGIVFVTQAATAEKTILQEITPLTSLSQIDPQYDKVTAAFEKTMVAEEPNIQAGKAAPSAMYAYLSGQRALLGLAKSNVGLAMFTRLSGIVGIVLGLGVVLSGLALLRKVQST